MRKGPTIPQLEKELENWEHSHKMLQKRLEKRDAAEQRKREGKPPLQRGQSSEEYDEDGQPIDYEEEEEEDEGTRFSITAPLTLDSSSQYALLNYVLDGLVAQEASAVANEALQERDLSLRLARRVMLGSVARAASGTKAPAPPELEQQLQSMYSDMRKRRDSLPNALHKHTNHLSIKWRGRRPRKATSGDADSSSSSDEEDSDGEGAGGVTTLALDDIADTPRSNFMRHNYVVAEGAYWAAHAVESTFINVEKDIGSACVKLHFSPNWERNLLAAGTKGGGLAVWHVDNGPTVTPSASLASSRAPCRIRSCTSSGHKMVLSLSFPMIRASHGSGRSPAEYQHSISSLRSVRAHSLGKSRSSKPMRLLRPPWQRMIKSRSNQRSTRRTRRRRTSSERRQMRLRAGRLRSASSWAASVSIRAYPISRRCFSR